MPRPKLLLILFALINVGISNAQDSTRLDRVISLPDIVFGALGRKSKSIEEKLEKQTSKYLDRLSRQENKLRKKLYKRDSSLAKQLFEGSDAKYEALKNISGKVGKYQNEYSGHLDSLSTALSFLNNSKMAGLADNAELQKTLSQYIDLQDKFNATNKMSDYLEQRRGELKTAFERLGMVDELKQFRKHVYYYQAQVKEYKATFEDPSKLEEKLLGIAESIPQFKNFFARYSMLGSMFALPSNNPAGLNATNILNTATLQTRDMLTQMLSQRVGNGTNVIQTMQQNGGGAGTDQLSQLKDKLNGLRSGNLGNSDAAMDNDLPNFKPNTQKTKSFLKRLEYGTNIQSVKSNTFFPTTSDIGLSIGYKINSKNIIGIGASYKMGWGSDIRHIALSSEGIGLRSFADMKLRGSFYVSGGFEYNYQKPFASIEQIKYLDQWQQSGLLGISKVLSMKTKMFKKTKIQVLWDFLSYQQRPVTQPIKFRVGYNF